MYFENRGLIENSPYCWRFEIENNYEKTSISSRWTCEETSSATAPIAPDPIIKTESQVVESIFSGVHQETLEVLK